MWFLEFLKDFIGAPAILISMFTLMGCCLQKKKFSQTIISTIKTFVGFIILQAGATILTTTLTTFSAIFQELFGLKGAIPLNEATAAMLAKQAKQIVNVGSFIMIFGMFMNIILAKFSRFKYVFLSGHCLFYMSVMLSGTAQMVGIVDINKIDGFVIAVLTGGLLMSLYMVIQPALTQRWMVQITNSTEIALAHTGGFGYMLSGWIGEGIGKIFKGKTRSTESIKFPKGLSFFRNTTVSIAILMFIIYLAIFIPTGIRYEMGLVKSKEVISILEEQNWLITGIIGAFTFAAAIEIILLGVRTFIAELIPAFKGISNKFIKNSKPGVDCPVVFPYAPNAVIIGFISAFFGGIVAMSISIAISYETPVGIYIILPSIMNIFFQGGTSGVFGNVKGGILGAVLGSFIQGIIFHLVPIIFLSAGWIPTVSDQNALNQVGWGDTDFLLAGIPAIFGLIGGNLGGYIYLIILIITVIVLLLDGYVKVRKDKFNTQISNKEITVENKTLSINDNESNKLKNPQVTKPINN